MRLVTILCLMCLCGCCPQRHISTSTQDSIRVEVIERIVKDTVEIIHKIPTISERVITRDTVSILENRYAITEAKIDNLGYLTHSLSTKPVKDVIKAPIEYINRDSIVWREKIVNNTIEVPRVETWWQKTQRTGFWILLSCLGLFVVFKLRKLLI